VKDPSGKVYVEKVPSLRVRRVEFSDCLGSGSLSRPVILVYGCDDVVERRRDNMVNIADDEVMTRCVWGRRGSKHCSFCTSLVEGGGLVVFEVGAGEGGGAKAIFKKAFECCC
jgi:hypothetical protein